MQFDVSKLLRDKDDLKIKLRNVYVENKTNKKFIKIYNNKK